jgi:hypothetical protein
MSKYNLMDLLESQYLEMSLWWKIKTFPNRVWVELWWRKIVLWDKFLMWRSRDDKTAK